MFRSLARQIEGKKRKNFMFTSIFRHKSQSARSQADSQAQRRCQPSLEHLEDRVVPYNLSGSKWASANVTYSFMPDGTQLYNGSTSSLFATLNAVAPTATWEAEIDRAIQAWASVSGLTLTRVSDDGGSEGCAGLAQGDPRFGDIRIGAMPMGFG